MSAISIGLSGEALVAARRSYVSALITLAEKHPSAVLFDRIERVLASLPTPVDPLYVPWGDGAVRWEPRP